ncbi:hypothetical protein W5M_06887 [Corynebacterium diphtheriae bv. intermedius str. NCTC 5011]|nr:hypothetical protein W5M_06887 [Corynebacterium diphtheriae bv. intermedius str. NCTC 5011]
MDRPLTCTEQNRKTVEDSIEHEIDLRQVWFDLCDDFKIPEQRR